jgi:hypothetical protein
MDDLKIIFYLVVTLLWFFFNNYRKLQKKARERRDQQPGRESQENSETPEFNWEEIFGKGSSSAETPDIEPDIPQAQPVEITRRQPLARSTPSEMMEKSFRKNTKDEIRTLKTSQRPGLRKALKKRTAGSVRSRKIRRSNWKKAVVLSEVLHPPYV